MGVLRRVYDDACSHRSLMSTTVASCLFHRRYLFLPWTSDVRWRLPLDRVHVDMDTRLFGRFLPMTT
jgi:hypothetical protein